MNYAKDKIQRLNQNKNFIIRHIDEIESLIQQHFPNCNVFIWHFGNEYDFSGIDCESNGVKFAIRTSDVKYMKYNDWILRETEYNKIKNDEFGANYYIRLYVCWQEDRIISHKIVSIETLKQNLHKAVRRENRFKYTIGDTTDFYVIQV